MMSCHYLLVFLVLFPICTTHTAHADDPLGQFCNKENNITTGSQISTNIGILLSNLQSKAALDGYAAASYGSGRDKVYGLAQCRGDVSREDCAACLADSAKQVRQRCPNQADARIWYDYCFLRYSFDDFVGKVDTSVGILYYNLANVTDPEAFHDALGNLMDKVRSEAVFPGNKGLGKSEKKLSALVTLYALAQCTRDLLPLSCAQCMAIAVENFGTICKDRKGCRVLYSSCYLRYELYPFFFPIGSGNNTGETAMVTVYS